MSTTAVPTLRIKHDGTFDHSKTPEFKSWAIEKLIHDKPRMDKLLRNAQELNWDDHLLLSVDYLRKNPVSLDVLAKMNTVIARICWVLLKIDEWTPEEMGVLIREL